MSAALAKVAHRTLRIMSIPPKNSCLAAAPHSRPRFTEVGFQEAVRIDGSGENAGRQALLISKFDAESGLHESFL
jgi:hypothetical protein